MESRINTDFKKWFINSLVKEGERYYFQVRALKVYVYFEGQTPEDFDALITIKISLLNTGNISGNKKYYSGFYRLYVYGENILINDRIVDTLKDLLEEKIIDVPGKFRLETSLLSTKSRGNKFKGSRHYESIIDVNFYHWAS